jgi:hypothetical protein
LGEVLDLIERIGHPEEFVCLEHGESLVGGLCEMCDWEEAERQYGRRADR